jgi:hypothetical protein
MKRFLALAAVATSLAVFSLPSQAVPVNTVPAVDSGFATQVQWRRCIFWRNECAVRWPGHGWRFRRCLAIHGCW